VGEFKLNMRHGKGKFIRDESEFEGKEYEGEWKNNKVCGKGKGKYKDGW
jgi:hypothetical protein